MFGATTKRSNKTGCSMIDILIGAKATVKGDIVFSGGLRVDGKVEGKIVANGQDNTTIVLGEYAEVTGNVAAAHIVILGTVRGNVHCSEYVELHPQAKISGDVHYKLIEIAPGATVNGKFVRETAESVEDDAVMELESIVAPGTTSDPKAEEYKGIA